MSLRAFLLIIAGGAVTLFLVLFTRQTDEVLGHAFRELEAAHLASVSQIAQSTIETAIYSLSVYRETLEANNDLAARLLVAHEMKRTSAISDELERFRREAHVDFVKLFYRDELSRLPKTLAPIKNSLGRAFRGERELFPVTLDGDLTLVSFARLRHYGETIAVVAYGISFDNSLAPKIAFATKASVRFGDVAKKTAFPLTFGGRTVWLAIESKFIDDQSQKTRRRMVLIGSACLALMILLLYLVLEFGFVRRFKRLLGAMGDASRRLDEGVVEPTAPVPHPIREVTQLSGAFFRFSTSLKQFGDRLRLRSRAEAFVNVVEQVNHDLKSPLSALDFMLEGGELREISDSRRTGIKECLRRIKETLHLLTPRQIAETEETLPVSLVSVLESIVREKQFHYSDRRSLRISLSTESPENAFVLIRANEFKRAVSNLIDNAAESISDEGEINITLTADRGHYLISISDDGAGIDEALLARVGQRGATFGKIGGSGLGVWYAREVATAHGGTLSLSSERGIGTVARIALPKPSAPRGIPLAIFLFACLYAAPTFASHALLSNDFVFSADPSPWLRSADTVSVSTKLLLPASESPVAAEYLTAVAKEKLGRFGITGVTDERQWLSALEKMVERAEVEERPGVALGAKLILELRRERNHERTLSIFLVEYEKIAERPATFRPSIRARHLRVGDLPDAPQQLTQFLRRTLDDYFRNRPESTERAEPRAKFRGNVSATYRPRSEWNLPGDPPPVATPSAPVDFHRRLQLGALVGTPAILNAQIGLWGFQNVPLNASLSGMYYSTTTRGVQTDLGFIFDRNGEWQQAVNLSVVGFNEHTEMKEDKLDDLGNVARTEIVSVDRLRMYLGPSYVVNYKGFKALGGIVFRPGEGFDSNTRFIIQIGYCPLLSF